MAAPDGLVGLEVFTHYVGDNAEMKIKLTDQPGNAFGTFTNKIHGNRFKVDVRVPAEAEQALYAAVELPQHGLAKTSNRLPLLPWIDVVNARWSQPEARRGDILTLTADVKGAPNGTEARITIFEHAPDGAHDLVTELLTLVEQEKVEVDWEFNFQGEVEDIPSHDEVEEGYQAPQFFFRVNVGGKTADSDLLTFIDFIEILVVDHEDVPLGELDFVVMFADCTEHQGTLDENGFARIEDVPPGTFTVEIL